MIALLASENSSKTIGTALWCDNPRTIRPWWIVSNVLVVTALELRHPMLLFILMKADDPFVHGSLRLLTRSLKRRAPLMTLKISTTPVARSLLKRGLGYSCIS